MGILNTQIPNKQFGNMKQKIEKNFLEIENNDLKYAPPILEDGGRGNGKMEG